MALFSRKDKTADIVKGVVEELTKAGAPMAAMMQAGQLQGSPVQTGVPVMAQQVVAATPLARPQSQFGAAFNPGTPLFPGAIDPVNPVTGRAEPRITQYQVAENLMITQEPAPFERLNWAARSVDIIARCITVRIDDITKMGWSFEVSDDAIAEIMAEENCSHAKAANIARDKYGKQIAEMTEAWANPFPLEYKNWRAWIAQAMWDYLVYDEVVVYPNYNLGGKCFGFDIIDPSTIKILRDDKGRVPSYPLPAYQQILWGYPRGEFTASPLNEVNAQFNAPEQKGPVRPSDSLSVFIGHPQTKHLYGFSPTEQALPFSDLYVNRQEWLLAEYKAGSTPAMFLETDSALELWQMADNDRILNDYYSGMTQNRQQIRSLPGGAKVVQTMQVDEKYKSEYDEFIAKRIAAIFGVAPSQVGVVARAGLGGGKGAADGEMQSAETVSTKPTINFIVDMVNNLSRQHLGMDENITFNITDDTSSTDQLNRYKALSTALNSGMLTENDVRGELGMPLFDMPEADEPFILTAAGPTFLKGQLETNSSGETVGQTGPSSDTQANPGKDEQANTGKENPEAVSESSPKETPVEAKSAFIDEMRDFAQFVKSRNKRGNWRAFDFVTVEEEMAEKLNEQAYFIVKGARPMPEKLATWAIEFAERQITDTPKGLVTKEYNPDQPRDYRGRWGEGDASANVQDWQIASGSEGDTSQYKAAQDWMTSNVTSVSALNSWDNKTGDPLYYGTGSQNIPDSVQATLNDYTQGGYAETNEALRDAGIDVMGQEFERFSLGDSAQQMQGLIDSSTTSSDVTVFRGMGADAVSGLSVGDTFVDNAFVSTSMLSGIAENFAGKSDGGIVAQIFVPSGSSAVGIASSELELLLGSNSQFRVDSINADTGAYNMTYLGRADLSSNKAASLSSMNIRRQKPKTDAPKFMWYKGDVKVTAKTKSSLPDVVKKDTGHEDRITYLANKHKKAIQVALAGSVVGVSTAIDHAVKLGETLDATAAAKQAVDAYINFNSTDSVNALKSLYTVAMQEGSQREAANVGADAILGERSQQLIQRAGYTIKGINDTTQNRIYTAIRDGVANGDAHMTIVSAVNDIINDPARALIIAETETNRGYQLAAQDVASANGATGFDWITDADPCPECEELATANPHDISELTPPDHPSCKCNAMFIYPSDNGSSDSTGD